MTSRCSSTCTWPGRLPLDKFVSETIGLGDVEEAFAKMEPRRGAAQRRGPVNAVTAGAAGPATRIAMWSGPRTVSTALMRAWENRPDTAVTDEPLYAFYLDRTGLDHPGRDEVIASQPTDWQVVLAGLARGPLPGGAAHRLRQAHDPPPAARRWTGPRWPRSGTRS